MTLRSYSARALSIASRAQNAQTRMQKSGSLRQRLTSATTAGLVDDPQNLGVQLPIEMLE
jgi:hypothetical protein